MDENKKPGCNQTVAGAGCFVVLLIILIGLLGALSDGTGRGDTTISEVPAVSTSTNTPTPMPEATVTDTPQPTPTRTIRPTQTPVPTQTAVPTSTVNTYAVVTVLRNANLRAGPGTDAAVAGTASAGDVLTVYSSTEDGWLMVAEDGSLWIGSSLVSGDLLLDDTQNAGQSVAEAEVQPTETAEPTETVEPTATPALGASVWMNNGGARAGVDKIRWDYSLGYYRADSQKIFLSLYIIVENLSGETESFTEDDFSVIDGGGEITGVMLFSEIEPSFGYCTVLDGGRCEGWWTTMIWDRPESRENLRLEWTPCWIFCDTTTTRIFSE